MSTLLRPAPARPYRRGNVHVRAGRMHSAPPGEKGSGSQMPAPAVRPRPSRSIRARRPYAGAMPECGRSGPHRVGVQSRLRIRKLASLGQFVSSGADTAPLQTDLHAFRHKPPCIRPPCPDGPRRTRTADRNRHPASASLFPDRPETISAAVGNVDIYSPRKICYSCLTLFARLISRSGSGERGDGAVLLPARIEDPPAGLFSPRQEIRDV